MSLIQGKNINLSYNKNDDIVLKNINITINPKDTISIIGSSGSGKSSLLNILSGLIKPTSGEILWNNQSITPYKQNDLIKLRRDFIGFIFQSHHLLMNYTALENIMLPNLVHTNNKKLAKEKAEYLLNLVGLDNKKNTFPSELSGGQKQRISIARALINNPKIILADEPTGSLDQATSLSVLDILLKTVEELNTALLLITHDINIANKMNYQMKIHNKELTLCTY